jgi:transposase
MVGARTHKALREALESLGERVLEGIEEVSIDLTGNYRSLIKKLMPETEIVADRFHVMKQVSQELNKTRNRLIRGEIEPSEGVTPEQIKEALKGSKYALLKPECRLTDKQKIKLNEVKAVSPLLAKMHQLKESFREVFETSTSEIEGTMALLDWMEKAKETFTEAVPTYCRWFREVSAYFQHRTTSGVVEGINNKLKLIKRSGYGFTNFERFRLRCLICWNLKWDSA